MFLAQRAQRKAQRALSQASSTSNFVSFVLFFKPFVLKMSLWCNLVIQLRTANQFITFRSHHGGGDVRHRLHSSSQACR